METNNDGTAKPFAEAHGSAWRLHHRERPAAGQLIVVVTLSQWRAGHVVKRGIRDYLDPGDELPPRMITYGAKWMPIDPPNDPSSATPPGKP